MERVRESVGFSGGRVDRSGTYPRVLDVAICGLSSVHGYDYDPRVWEGGRAKAMYEGLPSYVGHGGPDERDRTGEKLGWWENVSTRPDGRPCGDYCLNPKHPLAESVLWAAEHKPDFYTVSHVADVRKVKRPDGRLVVESMAGRAHSVDLVDVGGTQGSLRESGHKRKGAAVACTVKEYGNKLAPKCTVDGLLKLRSLVREDGMGDLPMPADAPPPDAEATTEDDGISAAFMAAITGELKACMDAKGDPARMKTCLGKVKKLLMAHGEIKAEDGDDAGADAAGDTGKAKESGQAKAPAVDPWEIVAECEREQYKPDATDLKVLKLVAESGDRLAYIRRQKGLVNATHPTSASRQQLAGAGDTAKESGGGGGQPAGGVEEARQIMARLSKDARGAS